MIRTAFILVMSILSFRAMAQVSPAEKASLNYRIIGFSFPFAKATSKGGTYKVEIAKGDYNNIDSFKHHIVSRAEGKESRLIAEVPDFGASYTWCVYYNGEMKASNKKSFFHFNTLPAPYSDTMERLHVTEKAKKYKDSYIFLDNSRGLYDMEGNLVWFLPKIDTQDRAPKLRDMKVSPQYTITCISGGNVYEVDYEGRKKWEGPETKRGRGTMVSYNHEFTRLKNGNYMVIITETRIVRPIDTVRKNRAEAHGGEHMRVGKTMVSNIVEYNPEGDTVWKWNTDNYFTRLMTTHTRQAMGPRKLTDPLHTNAFYFDENKKELYVSFRNVSQVVKVKYPSGEILDVYGADGSFNLADQQTSFFCLQHACKLSKQGYLYLFNNNSCETGRKPGAVVMQMPRSAKEKLKKVWEYECPADTSTIKKMSYRNDEERSLATAGGNVMDLNDGDMLISSCTPYGDVTIVNKDKDVLWQGISEVWNKYEKKWEQSPQYRMTLVSRQELEGIIWK